MPTSASCWPKRVFRSAAGRKGFFGHALGEEIRSWAKKDSSVCIGDGEKASFWHCNWTGDRALRYVYPTLFVRSRRKGRSVAAALRNGNWIRDLRHGDIDAIATYKTKGRPYLKRPLEEASEAHRHNSRGSAGQYSMDRIK